MRHLFLEYPYDKFFSPDVVQRINTHAATYWLMYMGILGE
jgi:hypothetical protein